MLNFILWFKKKTHTHHQLNQSNGNQNQPRLSHTRFPVLGTSYVYLLRVPIGSLWCLRCTSSTNHIHTKTNRELVTHVFPRLVPVTCICLEFPLVHCGVYVETALFYDTQLKTENRYAAMMTYCDNDNNRDSESPDEGSVRRHPAAERNDKTQVQNTASPC